MNFQRRPPPRRLSVAPALVMALVLAGCGGASDIADRSTSTPTSGPSSGSSPSVDGPIETADPTTPNDLSGLPKGFGDGPAGSGLSRFTQQNVDWTTCEGGECADVWVPLDYGDPDGLAITLKAQRQVATDPSKRRGSLLINPGGPGESGIDFLGFIGLPPSVRAQYDVVGFDPRGIGRSTPIDCLSDSDLDAYLAADPTPDNTAEITGLREDFAAYAQGCQDRSGPLIQHVSTVEVARDMDVMRQLLGDKRLNFFGASYGTYIGATYAGLFPGKVGRMVLDGAIDPQADPHQVALDQTVGFEKALDNYLQYCVSKGGCPLGDSVQAGKDRLIQFFKDVDAQPLPTTSGREVTEGIAFLGVIVPLYSKDSWQYLSQAMQQALDGNGDILAALSDIYTKRKPDGSYAENSSEAGVPVNCLDHPQNVSVDQILANRQEFVDKAPVFGGVGMWFDYGCSNWPVTPTEQQPDFTAKGAAPIVVVGTTRDPATPYQQAVRLAKELDSGVLLSRDGDGHTAYNTGNTCIDEAINRYLLTGTPPKDGTAC